MYTFGIKPLPWYRRWRYLSPGYWRRRLVQAIEQRGQYRKHAFLTDEYFKNADLDLLIRPNPLFKAIVESGRFKRDTRVRGIKIAVPLGPFPPVARRPFLARLLAWLW